MVTVSLVVVTASRALSCFLLNPTFHPCSSGCEREPLPALGGLPAPFEPQFPHLAEG